VIFCYRWLSTATETAQRVLCEEQLSPRSLRP
jgi:hypothetical protein